MNLLEVENLKVSVGKKEILKGVNLKIKKGETHFLMGPNGSGKSALAFSLTGHPNYQVKKGELIFDKVKINKLTPDKRAKMGIFLSFQNPLEFEGVFIFNFLKESLSSLGRKKIDLFSLGKEIKDNLQSVGLKEEFSDRYLNFGFSGGEKKKSEIIQLLTLKPKLAILDEIDSGLDIDSLKAVAKTLKKLKNNGVTFLVITHLDRIVKYLEPDRVHIMADGKIIKSGKKELVKKIEKKGYKSFNSR